MKLYYFLLFICLLARTVNLEASNNSDFNWGIDPLSLSYFNNESGEQLFDENLEPLGPTQSNNQSHGQSFTWDIEPLEFDLVSNIPWVPPASNSNNTSSKRLPARDEEDDDEPEKKRQRTSKSSSRVGQTLPVAVSSSLPTAFAENLQINKNNEEAAVSMLLSMYDTLKEAQSNEQQIIQALNPKINKNNTAQSVGIVQDISQGEIPSEDYSATTTTITEEDAINMLLSINDSLEDLQNNAQPIDQEPEDQEAEPQTKKKPLRKKLRGINTIPEDEQKEIIDEFKEELNLKDIAKRHKIALSHLCKLESLRPHIDKRIIELKRQEFSDAQIGNDFGLARSTIKNTLIKLKASKHATSHDNSALVTQKVQITSQLTKKRKILSSEQLAEISKKIINGEKLPFVATEYNMALLGLCRIKTIRPAIEERIETLNQQGLSLQEIGDLIGLQVDAIYRVLKRKDTELLEEKKLEIIKKFNEGESVSALAKQYKIRKAWLCHAEFFKGILKKRILDLDARGINNSNIGKLVGFSHEAIRLALERYKQFSSDSPDEWEQDKAEDEYEYEYEDQGEDE